MQQTAALAAPALLRHARRALLVLGAGFVWWLMFSGGAAHADGSGSPDRQATGPGLGQVLSQTPGQLVDRAAAATGTALRTTPRHLTRTLAEATTTAPAPVRTTVDALSAALEPTLTATTTAVADTVDRTVATARPALDVAAPPTSAPVAPAAGAQPEQRSKAPHHHRLDTARTAGPAGVVAAATFVADAAPHHAGPLSGPLPGPLSGDHPSLPSSPAAPSAPASPGGAPAGPMAALGGLLLTAPVGRRLRRTDERSAGLPDPVYPPGCSPD